MWGPGGMVELEEERNLKYFQSRPNKSEESKIEDYWIKNCRFIICKRKLMDIKTLMSKGLFQ